jgi:hypothetical protein
MRIRICVPPDNQHGPERMRQALAAIHEAISGHAEVKLGFDEVGGTVGLFCEFPDWLADTVDAQLHAAYPDARTELSPKVDRTSPERSLVLRLKPDVYPLLRHQQFEEEGDPVGGILEALAAVADESTSVSAKLTVRPASPLQRRRLHRAIRTLAIKPLQDHDWLQWLYLTAAYSRFVFLRVIARCVEFFVSPPSDRRRDLISTTARRCRDAEHQLQTANDKANRHLFDVQLRVVLYGPQSRADARNILRQVAAALGRLTVPGLSAFHPVRRFLWKFDRRGTFLLSDAELATLWHLPTFTARSFRQHTSPFRQLEPPVNLPLVADVTDITAIGQVDYRKQSGEFGVFTDDRRRHLFVVGKTGMGKTTLLRNLILSDISAGRGVAIIDPHGDLANDTVSVVPAWRTNDVVLFDAGDRDHPIAFNPLTCTDPHERPLRAAGIVSAFRKLYSDSWGPRLEHILRYTVLALIETPGASLLSIGPMLTNGEFRRDVLAHVSDPVVAEFFRGEFQSWNDRYRSEATAPVLNKVGQFVANPILRAILAAPESKLDLREVMDEGRILIVNLSKGRVGDDGSSLLGSLVVTCLQLAAMGRADVPESERRDFFAYVDEFQNFATDSFATILSEARKYRLSLTLANQYLDQIEETTLSAVFGNVGTILSFNLGADDAETIANQFGGDMTPRDLMNLPKYSAYARLLIDGQPTRPFSMRTIAPVPVESSAERTAIVRRTSFHRYGVTTCPDVFSIPRPLAKAVS